jgi:hypothetical protein
MCILDTYTLVTSYLDVQIKFSVTPRSGSPFVTTSPLSGSRATAGFFVSLTALLCSVLPSECGFFLAIVDSVHPA